MTDASLEAPTHGDPGGYARGALNLPLGDTVAARIVTYWHHLPGFIDAVEPGGGLHKAQNDGDRTGARVSLLVKPNDALSITPRVVYQNLTTNGFPRVDLYNMLANPFTTVAPVSLGDRQQYIQQREGLLDQFLLSDVKVDYGFGPATLTSVTSFTHRDVRVLRDATQLTGSVTYDPIGITDQASVRISSPLYDRSKLNIASEELRLASSGDQLVDWVVGGFFQHVNRHYGQDLPTPGYDALIGAPSSLFNAPPDTPFYSDLSYRLKQYAAFGEATWHITHQWALTAGLRYYKFNEDKNLLFGGAFADDTCVPGTGPGTPNPCVLGVVPASTDSSGTSPRVIVSYKPADNIQLSAQAARGFRLGGINDPINVPLCSPADLTVFGNQKTWDFGISATVVDAKLTSSVTSTLPGIVPTVVVVGGLADGNRLPTAPKTQAAASVGYTLPVQGGRDFFANFTVQYIGPSFSQFENQKPGFGQICTAIGEPADTSTCPGNPNAGELYQFGGPLSVSSFSFNTELPSYTLGNLRFGLKTGRWQLAAYINNIWDETARLALDYERGRNARIGYLTNQPRTIGVYGSYIF